MTKTAHTALTEQQKSRIVLLFTSGDATIAQLAERFGVSRPRISQIISEWEKAKP